LAFQDVSNKINVPTNNFDDYLGKGFSGDVMGKERELKVLISDFKFTKPIVAFPDSNSIRHLTIVPDRWVLLEEILKRFSIVFDYRNRFVYLKKNRNYLAHLFNKAALKLCRLACNGFRNRTFTRCSDSCNHMDGSRERKVLILNTRYNYNPFSK
jgi:hypothetical protein